MNNQEQARISQEYERRRSASVMWRLVLVPLASGLGVTGGIAFVEGDPVLIFLALLLLAGTVFALWRFAVTWRCPVCNTHLGRDPSTTYCRNCGVRLQG